MRRDAPNPRPIGVFDSGVGGLTVLRALTARLPDERFIYLGDTARLPYGTKSPQTVVRYARQAAQVLVDADIKLLVIACNTASAVAVDELAAAFAPLPVLGVVEPGAAAACARSRGGRTIVIATEGTIRGGAYERAIERRRPGLPVVGIACPMFVALAEEGWTDGAIPEAIARRYLQDVVSPSQPADTLVLGCTHFPVLKDVLQRVVGPGVTIVDSAETTAQAVWEQLHAPSDPAPAPARREGEPPMEPHDRVQLWATDDPQRFARVGGRFLDLAVEAGRVRVVDL
jgi:glutamate racemase